MMEPRFASQTDDPAPASRPPTLTGYEIVRRLGKGGMGHVYLARQSCLGRWVVLKTLAPQHSGKREWVDMFEREARIAARMQHPNLVVVFDVVSTSEGPCLAMEYIEGVSFRELLERVGRAEVSLDCQLYVLRQLLAGLEYFHQLADDDGAPLHLVHRDVTPDNIMLTLDGQVKLVDLGIAKARDAPAGAYETRVPTVKGKPRYMSPEQARGVDAVDARSDLYSVGAMLWEAVAGRGRWPDHLGEDDILAELIQTGSDAEIETPGAALRGVPELDAICRRALSVRRQRYASASEMAAALASATPEPTAARAVLAQLIAAQFGAEIEARKRRVPNQPSDAAEASWQTLPKAVGAGPTPADAQLATTVDASHGREHSRTGPSSRRRRTRKALVALGGIGVLGVALSLTARDAKVESRPAGDAALEATRPLQPSEPGSTHSASGDAAARAPTSEHATGAAAPDEPSGAEPAAPPARLSEPGAAPERVLHQALPAAPSPASAPAAEKAVRTPTGKSGQAAPKVAARRSGSQPKRRSSPKVSRKKALPKKGNPPRPRRSARPPSELPVYP